MGQGFAGAICIADLFGPPGINDASQHCAYGFEVDVFIPTFSPYDQLDRWDAKITGMFARIRGAVRDWEYANGRGTQFKVSLSPAAYDFLSGLGFQSAGELTWHVPTFPGPPQFKTVLVIGVFGYVAITALYD